MKYVTVAAFNGMQKSFLVCTDLTFGMILAHLGKNKKEFHLVSGQGIAFKSDMYVQESIISELDVLMVRNINKRQKLF